MGKETEAQRLSDLPKVLVCKRQKRILFILTSISLPSTPCRPQKRCSTYRQSISCILWLSVTVPLSASTHAPSSSPRRKRLPILGLHILHLFYPGVHPQCHLFCVAFLDSTPSSKLYLHLCDSTALSVPCVMFTCIGAHLPDQRTMRREHGRRNRLALCFHLSSATF